jgi:hypothetical protein
MRTHHVIVLALVAAAASPASAGKGHQARYVGIHPVPKPEGGGICYIEGPHVHVYAANRVEYRDHHGASYFVGDPVAYGYDGPRHAYKGHHPIHVDVVVGDDDPDVEYCYLDGPHFHTFESPVGPEFKVAGDAYFYVGEPAPVYLEARPQLIKINAMYTPLVYARPTIEVEAPEGWIGVRFATPAVIVEERPAAVVVPAGRVQAGVRIGIGAEVYVPPPPSVHVDVGVGIGFGGGISVGGGGGGHDRGRRPKKWKGR